LVQRIKKIKI